MNIPILLLVFNRPKETEILLNKLKKIKPTKLYVSQDGPRTNSKNDMNLCNEVQKILKELTWKCEIIHKINKINLGCRMSVSSAISWFFEKEEMGIILEDDCIPSESFFLFCDKMLNKYKNSKNVFLISGSNFQNNKLIGDGDYYFSKYAHCWGWATWKRAWKYYDNDMIFWNDFRNSKSWNILNDNKLENKYWRKIFDKVQANKIDSWAYVWLASVWNCNGLTIIPNKNLILNIGFNRNATNTINSSDISEQDMKFHELNSEIKDPSNSKVNKKADLFVFNNHFNGKFNFWPWRLLYILKILLQDPKTFWLKLKKKIQ